MFRRQCNYCGAEIIWRRSNVTGKFSPLDARPWSQGTIMIHDDGITFQVLTLELVQQARDRGVDLYTNHVGTCLVPERRN